MRRQLSLGMLFARSSLRRVLGILLVMTAAQVLLARAALEPLAGFVEADGFCWTPPAEILDGGWFRLVSALGLTAIVAAVMLSSGGFGSRCDYTASRLPVRRWTVYIWSILCALGMLLLFWAVQLAVCMGVVRWYASVTSWDGHNSQLMLLEAYRSGLLHRLLPLQDGLRLVNTIVYFLGLGTLAGVWSVRAFSGKWSALPLILAMAWWFDAGGVGSTGWTLLLAVAALAFAFAAVWGDREELP